jgi:hypothetical protein
VSTQEPTQQPSPGTRQGRGGLGALTAEGIDQPPAPGVRRDDPRATAAERACGQRGEGGR